VHKSGSGQGFKLKQAQILLAADAGASDEEIARSIGVGGSTVYRTKRRFVIGNLEAALSEEPRPGAERKRRRRTVSREMLSCWVSLTSSPARSSSVQRARPSGGFEQAVATSRASSLPESEGGQIGLAILIPFLPCHFALILWAADGLPHQDDLVAALGCLATATGDVGKQRTPSPLGPLPFRD
jgi:hypothetical protein